METTGIALIAAAVVFPTIAKENNGADAWSEDNAMKMSLELVELPGNDLQRAVLKLTVTNTGEADLILDRELAVGFVLSFETDLTKEGWLRYENHVTTKETKRIDKPKPRDVKSRFVRLKPRHSLSRTYDLARPVREVISGWAVGPGVAPAGSYYEATRTYHVPAKATRLSIIMWYERGSWEMTEPQFKKWFAKSPQEIGLWEGRARSNTLVIQKE
jgi:hypothetical protein